jgi:hypothetical protein
MSFTNFSGVFGVYEGIKLIEIGRLQSALTTNRQRAAKSLKSILG